MKWKFVFWLWATGMAFQLTAQNPEDSLKTKKPGINLDTTYVHGKIQKIKENFSQPGIIIYPAIVTGSPEDILRTDPAVDIRSRGPLGVQSDIHFRGGNFDQTLVMLNGIPMNNPQTGHHTLDLPVDAEMIEHVFLLPGASASSLGANAYTGAINFITREPRNNSVMLYLQAGQYGYLKTGTHISYKRKNWAILNGFSFQKSDGYLPQDSINNTDFQSVKEFLQIHYQTKPVPVTLQAGFHDKKFGANSFYTAKFPWQYEKTRGYLLSLASSFGQTLRINPQVYYQWNRDEFQLFRESVYAYQNGFFIHQNDTAQYAPGVYYPGHNYHQTRKTGGKINMEYPSSLGNIHIRISVENDKILSNKLGKPLDRPVVISNRIQYTRGDERTYWQSGISHTMFFPSLMLGGSLNLLYEPHYKFHPTGNLFLRMKHGHFIHEIRAGSAVRLPTFTDLYYQGPSNTGNPDLQPEKAFHYEWDSRYATQNFFLALHIFLRDSRNTIDWIKYNVQDKWKPENLTRLKTYGLEVHSEYDIQHHAFIFGYAHLYMDKENNPDFISKYVLDYLKNKWTFQWKYTPSQTWNISTHVIYKDRNGSYLDYKNGQYELKDFKPYWLLNLDISKKYRKHRFSLSVNNLFNTEYRDLSYVKMPGRWIILGWKYIFSQEKT